MSGIAGIFTLHGRPAGHSQLEPMLEALKHRGPEHSAAWIGGPVALACRLLRTTPESLSERLPFCHEARQTVITADARIDNRDQLIAELGMSGMSPVSDSAIILAAYERWGRQCPEKLVGDFAFAIWDGREGALFCARDHFGVRPFVYTLVNGFFAFSSQIRGLLAIPGLPRRVNETQVLEYLAGYFENPDETFYQDIRKLPPAHSLIVDANGCAASRYWSLEPSTDLRLASDAEYAEAFRAHFVEAVRCRVRSAVALGSTLSGGLDSSSVACTARTMLQERGGPDLHTFSVIFDDVPQCDERSYMQAALATGGMEPHTIHGDRVGPLLDIDRVLDHLGTPFLGPNLFLHWQMYGAAQRAGVGVLLDGLDGDTTVSHGVCRITELAGSWRWLTAVKEARAIAQRFNTAALPVLRNRVLVPLVPAHLRRAWWRIRKHDLASRSAPLGLNPEFRKRMRFDERADEMLNQSSRLPLTEKEAHFRSLTRGLLGRVLEVTDGASAAFSLEARYPFFDRRLIEFCLSLPADQKLRNGWSRWVMRQGMEGILPAAIQWRGGKSNLEPNFVYSLHTFDRDRLREIIDAESERLAEYLDMNALRARLDMFITEKTSSDGQSLLQTAILGLWLRTVRL